ncbi:MAG TPA: SIMPL domain-containing protein [Candidatus Dormibacteraeota bacterium]|nr:SIMPL domain-containing protein [Candidatus Dormibacteraeota bacterium]
MTPSARPVLFSGAVATVCAVAVALAVVAGNRPQVVVAAPAALPQSTSTFTPGVFASGDATVSTKPDVAFLMVGVQSSRPTAASAQSDLASKAAKLIAKAKAIGVADKDISTSGYSVNPNYVGSNTTIDGYNASEQISLKWHNVDSAGNALDTLVQSGGATNVSVGFGLADPKAAQAQARALAIADARTKAQAMAAAAGVRLGPVMRVSDLSTSGAMPMFGGAYDSRAAAAPTQLPVGQLDVQVTVEVDFEIV